MPSPFVSQLSVHFSFRPLYPPDPPSAPPPPFPRLLTLGCAGETGAGAPFVPALPLFFKNPPHPLLSLIAQVRSGREPPKGDLGHLPTTLPELLFLL